MDEESLERQSPGARTISTSGMRLMAAGLLLACAVVYMAGNGRMPLFDRDEGWYADVSRTMIWSGDWVVPRFRQDLFRKPVFAFWCQAVSMECLGQTEFAARFPSVVCALATLVVVGWIVARFAGPQRGLWTAFVLASSVLFIGLAKLALTDSELLLWITIAQICLAALYLGKTSVWISILLWMSVALAILTKGPVVIGMLAPTVIVLVLLDVGPDFRSAAAWRNAVGWWLRTRPWLALLIVPAIVGPWVYLVEKRAPGFMEDMLGHNIAGPIFDKPMNSRSTMPWFYLATIWPTFLPWSLLLPLAMVKGWINRRMPAVRFSMAAVIGPFIVISLVKQKLPHYLLPLFPPLAFLTADVIVRGLRGQYDLKRLPGWSWGVMIWSIFIALICAAPWLLAWPKFQIHGLPYAALTIITLIGLTTCTLNAWLLISGRLAAGFVAMGVGAMSLVIVTTVLVIPSVAPLQGARLAGAAMKHAGFRRGETVALIGYGEPSITYYLDGSGTQFPNDYLGAKPPEAWPIWIVLSGDIWNHLPAEKQQLLDCIGAYGSLSVGSTGGTGQIVVLRNKSSPRDPMPAAVSN